MHIPVGALTMVRAGYQADPRDVFQRPTGKATGPFRVAPVAPSQPATTAQPLTTIQPQPQPQPHTTAQYLQPSTPNVPAFAPGTFMVLPQRGAIAPEASFESVQSDESQPMMTRTEGTLKKKGMNFLPLALAALGYYFL